MIPALRLTVMMWQPDSRSLRHLEPVLRVDRRVVAIEDVDAAAVELVRRHVGRDLVAGPALDRVVRPVLLARRVVRQLVLVQDRDAALAVPDGVVLLEVLDEEAGRGSYRTARRNRRMPPSQRS